MAELRVTDEMVAAYEVAEACAPKGSPDKVITRLGIVAALQAGGFTEERRLLDYRTGEVIGCHRTPPARRLPGDREESRYVGPWREVMPDGE